MKVYKGSGGIAPIILNLGTDGSYNNSNNNNNAGILKLNIKGMFNRRNISYHTVTAYGRVEV
jgi:hypothetical protein